MSFWLKGSLAVGRWVIRFEMSRRPESEDVVNGTFCLDRTSRERDQPEDFFFGTLRMLINEIAVDTL